MLGEIQHRYARQKLGNEGLSHDDVNRCSAFKIIVLG